MKTYPSDLLATGGTHALRHAAAMRLSGVPQPAPPAWLVALARDLGVADAGPPHSGDAEWRLAVFRAHHAIRVRAASPLALDALASLGFDADRAAWRLGPDARWPTWLCGPRPLLARRFAYRWKCRAAPAPDDGHDRAAFLHGGVRLDDPRRRGVPAGVRLSRAGLDVALALGSARLRTLGGLASLTTSAAVPETVKAACVGRDVGELFDHPCLAGRGWPIVSQFDVAPRRSWQPEEWTVVVATGTIAWRVPWSQADDGQAWSGE